MKKKEYIERGAALLAIAGQPSELHYPSWYKGNIMEVPAADVAEVVRCKDCKHWQHEEDVDFVCTRHYGYRTSMDFCSQGERKEE